MLNCLDLYARLTSTIPGMCLGGVCTLMAWLVMSSLHTGIVPKITWSPSKKFSPMMTIVWPPAVQPSAGDSALTWGTEG